MHHSVRKTQSGTSLNAPGIWHFIKQKWWKFLGCGCEENIFPTGKWTQKALVVNLCTQALNGCRHPWTHVTLTNICTLSNHQCTSFIKEKSRRTEAPKKSCARFYWSWRAKWSKYIGALPKGMNARVSHLHKSNRILPVISKGAYRPLYIARSIEWSWRGECWAQLRWVLNKTHRCIRCWGGRMKYTSNIINHPTHTAVERSG